MKNVIGSGSLHGFKALLLLAIFARPSFALQVPLAILAGQTPMESHRDTIGPEPCTLLVDAPLELCFIALAVFLIARVL